MMENRFPHNARQITAPIQETPTLGGSCFPGGGFQRAGWATSLPPSPSLEEATVLKVDARPLPLPKTGDEARKEDSLTSWRNSIQRNLAPFPSWEIFKSLNHFSES